ncbi:hypothetical protein ELI03_14180 [Rhizobium leguminosarum]|uniref:Uncharacterized protein n=1 Tax=Rhizobium leguminosarum TaxID=384 RepID=A0A4Q8Y9H7_RHILE|nr:hypothetical protein [Rhizobium leguminosarum]TAX72814.1 hypothetical protein ELI03_14180 [Rhizobium leguminosarum]
MKYNFETFENQKAEDVGALIKGDVAIVSASWESRSQAALSVLEDLPLKKLIVIRFEDQGKTGVSGNIRGYYRNLCRKKHIQHVEITFDSVTHDYATLAHTVRQIVSHGVV